MKRAVQPKQEKFPHGDKVTFDVNGALSLQLLGRG